MKRFSNKARILLLLCIATGMCCFLISGKPETKSEKAVASYFVSQLDELEKIVLQFEDETETATVEQMKGWFVQARFAYKRIEWLVEYHFPVTALKLNGPALPEAEPSEPGEALHPSGFQVLEEKLYDEEAGQLRKEIFFELSTILNRVRHLQAMKDEVELTESNILDALKLHVYRIITKGITGFDSPVAGNSIDELKPSLQSLKAVLTFFESSSKVIKQIDAALAYIKKSGADFNNFNRAVFIVNYLNPLSALLTDYQLQQKIPFVPAERAIAANAKTLFAAKAWQPLFYAPSGTAEATPAQIALGKILFQEPLLSSTGKRSCASCHKPELAFTDGLSLNTSLSGSESLLRNTPTLLNAALQPVQFYDSRIAFLEDQVHDVISNEKEMGGMFDQIVNALRRKKSYRKGFALAFTNKKLSAGNIRVAMAVYVRSLLTLDSSFDRYMRGDEKAMNRDQVAGFNLFAGKAKCATCHFMPNFSGSVPPLFDKMESEVLGVPATKDTLNAKMDLDSGKYHLYRIQHHLFSFKTPSLRNVALTAPYMHNGVYSTLEEVIDFYDRGGGAGLGFSLSNQTLPSDRLELTANEKKQLIAFLHALTDFRTKNK